MLISGDTDAAIDEIERFLTGAVRSAPQLNRILATVLFTGLVESTRHLARVGDRGWSELLDRHHAIVRDLLKTYRGQEVDTTGDGFFATFDGPARAIRCAQEIARSLRPLGLEVRAGIHTGECEIADGKAAGIAVVVAARVMAQAVGGQVLVTNMVKDLVAGSGLTFAAAGAYELKGSPTHGSYIPPSIDEREARSGQTLEANLICGRHAAKLWSAQEPAHMHRSGRSGQASSRGGTDASRMPCSGMGGNPDRPPRGSRARCDTTAVTDLGRGRAESPVRARP